jgi:hypothetical protein
LVQLKARGSKFHVVPKFVCYPSNKDAKFTWFADLQKMAQITAQHSEKDLAKTIHRFKL